MKNSILMLSLLLITCSCQVKDQTPDDGLIVGHKAASNSFTITPPASGSYYTSDTVTFALTFPVAINVDTTLGVPYLVLNVGGISLQADYVSGSNTQTILFEYTVGGPDLDSDGIDLQWISLNGATLTYMSGTIIKNCNTNFTLIHFPAVLINSL